MSRFVAPFPFPVDNQVGYPLFACLRLQFSGMLGMFADVAMFVSDALAVHPGAQGAAVTAKIGAI